jgi:hypothetical protein
LRFGTAIFAGTVNQLFWTVELRFFDAGLQPLKRSLTLRTWQAQLRKFWRSAQAVSRPRAAQKQSRKSR